MRWGTRCPPPTEIPNYLMEYCNYIQLNLEFSYDYLLFQITPQNNLNPGPKKVNLYEV